MKLQSHFRRKKAINVFQTVRAHAKAKVIQAILRRRLAWRRILKLRDFKARVIFIQRFYRRRYRQKKFSAISVQS